MTSVALATALVMGPRPDAKVLPFPSAYRMVKNKAGDGAEIYIYGVIGGDWFGSGVTADQFAKDLKALGKVNTIHVRFNSEGGDVFTGKAIYSLLNEHSAKIVGHVDGLAASAASFILMACDEIEIAESAFIMIHNATGGCWGGAEDMRKTADLLESVNNSIVDVYTARTKNDAKTIQKWMDDETWMIGKEAVTNGFADRVVENLKVAAMAGVKTSPMMSDAARKAFKKLPAALRPNRAKALAVMNASKAAS